MQIEEGNHPNNDELPRWIWPCGLKWRPNGRSHGLFIKINLKCLFNFNHEGPHLIYHIRTRTFFSCVSVLFSYLCPVLVLRIALLGNFLQFWVIFFMNTLLLSDCLNMIYSLFGSLNGRWVCFFSSLSLVVLLFLQHIRSVISTTCRRGCLSPHKFIMCIVSCDYCANILDWNIINSESTLCNHYTKNIQKAYEFDLDILKLTNHIWQFVNAQPIYLRDFYSSDFNRCSTLA